MSVGLIVALLMAAALVILIAYITWRSSRPRPGDRLAGHEIVHENTLEVLKQRYGTDHGDREVERERWREAS